MFEAAVEASQPIEVFTTWLLVAAAAVASFLIGNAERLIPIIRQSGFIICGAFLCFSCVFGLLSKIYGLRCQIGLRTSLAVRKTFDQHHASYQIEEAKIKEGADSLGITLQTGIRLERILQEFFAPMPWWVRWIGKRHLQKYSSNPQVGYISQIKNLNAQSLNTFLQAISFLGFLVFGFVFAAGL